MGFPPSYHHHHIQWRWRLNRKPGQSDASLSKQPCPGEMGRFVPLDKIDPSYLHLMLPVPPSFSLRSFAEAFLPPPPPNTTLNTLQKRGLPAALCWSCRGSSQTSGPFW